MKHVFVHLLNDFSGSPRILNDRIRCYQQAGRDCFVVTNDGRGFISLDKVPHRLVSYAKHRMRLIWAARLVAWYPRAAMALIGVVRSGDTLHCNTLLTAPLMLVGRALGARCVSHIMESQIKPAAFKRVLRACVGRFADRVVYLSRYVAEEERFPGDALKSTVTYPAVNQRIFEAGSRYRAAVHHAGGGTFSVGMICSVAWHKGIREFVQLAGMASRGSMRFILVVNGSQESLLELLGLGVLPEQVEVLFNVADVSEVLSRIDVLVSLTNRRGWVETFGLTLVEAMAFGKPVIAPDVGAPREFVRNGHNGYLVDESDLHSIHALLQNLRLDSELWGRLSIGAAETASNYSPQSLRAAIDSELIFVGDAVGKE